jgi:hypothetical protein
MMGPHNADGLPTVGIMLVDGTAVDGNSQNIPKTRGGVQHERSFVILARAVLYSGCITLSLVNKEREGERTRMGETGKDGGGGGEGGRERKIR